MKGKSSTIVYIFVEFLCFFFVSERHNHPSNLGATQKKMKKKNEANFLRLLIKKLSNTCLK